MVVLAYVCRNYITISVNRRNKVSVAEALSDCRVMHWKGYEHMLCSVGLYTHGAAQGWKRTHVSLWYDWAHTKIHMYFFLVNIHRLQKHISTHCKLLYVTQ